MGKDDKYLIGQEQGIKKLDGRKAPPPDEIIARYIYLTHLRKLPAHQVHEVNPA